ncbi:hypothetical protein G7046_g392 [Stylonectria norvegica]|nr:hypothetical protein G7046_g392 [Stylonectria norvegica]
MADTQKSPEPTAAPGKLPVMASGDGSTSSTRPPTVPISPEIVGDDDDDADSALGDDRASSTESLRSSIYDYRVIRGRTFHRETGNASYWGPNDDRHSDSLDVLHHLFTLLLDGELFVAPVTSPKKILDVGTGTGIWAIDVADKFPDCEVIGTDISPIQPSWIPPNVQFEIEDCSQEWTFEHNSFDFIHIRYLGGCIVDWAAFFKEAYKATRPGGYLESHEASPVVYSDDGTLPESSAIAQWGPLFIEGGEKIGRSFTIVDDGTQRKAMEDAGFVDIQEKLIKVPSGGWPADPKLKEIGEFAQFAVMSDVESFILFFTSILGWSREEVIVFIARLRRELNSLKHHVYYYQRIVYGRKPTS